MQWIAPSEREATSGTRERRLWDSVDHFLANSGLVAQRHFDPIVGVILLHFAEVCFVAQRPARKGRRIFAP